MRMNKGNYGKTLIIHDRFMFRGGAERLVLDMARGLRADIATGFWDDDRSFPRSDAPANVYVLGKLVEIPGVRYLYLLFLFLFKTRSLVKKYDTIVFSGNNCLIAGLNVPKNVPKIFYSHSPVRHAYDLREYYIARASWWKKPILAFLIMGSRIVYESEIKLMDTVVTNSAVTKDRFRHYLNMDVDVIYPPIQTKKFKWIGQGDYYMTVGRVDRFKRIPDIVRAFREMPDKKLIIPSGGDDLEKVREMSEGYDNITVLGWVSDEKLFELVGNCIATMYIPINEDAGMAQLEGMSAGKPCISVDEGGMKISVIHEKTGILIPPDYSTEHIIEAVGSMTRERALSMKDDCVNMAQKFGYDRFINEMEHVIDDTRKNKLNFKKR